jgi:hypothetical protein
MNQFGLSTQGFYRKSGKVPFLGIILFFIIGGVGLTILGLIYGFVIFYIPFAQLGAFAVIGYAFAGSYVLTKAITIGKLRNPILIGLLVFGFSIYAEYIGWIAWIATLAKDARYLLEFFFPWEVLSIILELGVEGVWSLSGSTPKGAFLYLIWIVEALTVIGGITYLTIKSAAAMIFCEESNMWVTKKTLLGIFSPIADPRQIKLDVAQGNLSIFGQLSPATPNSSHFSLLEVYECEHCNNFRVLNLDDGVITQDRRGNMGSKTKPIIKNLLVSAAFLSNLKRTLEEKRISSLESAS